MTEGCDDKDADVIIIPKGSATMSGGTITLPSTGGGLVNFDDILAGAPPNTGGGIIQPGGTINVPTVVIQIQRSHTITWADIILQLPKRR
jgi:hypothetical protein